MDGLIEGLTNDLVERLQKYAGPLGQARDVVDGVPHWVCGAMMAQAAAELTILRTRAETAERERDAARKVLRMALRQRDGARAALRLAIARRLEIPWPDASSVDGSIEEARSLGVEPIDPVDEP